MADTQPALFKGAPKAKRTLGDGQDEHWHQSRFVRWARETARLQTDQQIREALEWLHSVPNGSYVYRTEADHGMHGGKRRAPRQALKLIEEGLTAGVWDLRLDWVQRDSTGAITCPGLIIEMKMPGRYLSDEQKAYRAFMVAQGFRDAFCRKWQQAARAVVDYMGLLDYAPIYP